MKTNTTFKVGDTIHVATHGKVNSRIISNIKKEKDGVIFSLENFTDQIHQDFARQTVTQAQTEADQQNTDSRKSSLDQIKMRHKSNAILRGFDLEWVHGVAIGLEKSFNMYKAIAFQTAQLADPTITEEQTIKALKVRNALNTALDPWIDSDTFSRAIVEEHEKNVA